MKIAQKFLKADIERLKKLKVKGRRSEVIIGAQLLKLKQSGKISQEQFNEVMGISNSQEHS